MKLNELFENKKGRLNEAIGDTSIDVYSSRHNLKVSIRNIRDINLDLNYRKEYEVSLKQLYKELMNSIEFASKEDRIRFEDDFWLLDPGWADQKNYKFFIDLQEKASQITEAYQNLLKSLTIETSMEEKEFLTGIIQRLSQVRTKEQLAEFFNDPRNEVVVKRKKE